MLVDRFLEIPNQKKKLFQLACSGNLIGGVLSFNVLILKFHVMQLEAFLWRLFYWEIRFQTPSLGGCKEPTPYTNPPIL